MYEHCDILGKKVRAGSDELLQENEWIHEILGRNV
jgi:hypothetical protein